jgi:hypothetical protein
MYLAALEKAVYCLWGYSRWLRTVQFEATGGTDAQVGGRIQQR